MTGEDAIVRDLHAELRELKDTLARLERLVVLIALGMGIRLEQLERTKELK